MGTRLYVGNLPYAVTELDLRDLFGGIGTVTDAKIVTDRETGRPRGFGFVEMSTEDEARKAIEEINGRDVQGRQVAVKEAEDRRGGGGGGGGRGGGGGGYGGWRRRWWWRWRRRQAVVAAADVVAVAAAVADVAAAAAVAGRPDHLSPDLSPPAGRGSQRGARRPAPASPGRSR